VQGVILAAGKGKRLHPLTLTRSKAMMPVVGRPMVERVMETIYRNGITDFILVVSADDQDIVPYFTEACPAGVRVRFVTQQDRLGMADALRQAAPLIEGDFVLSACDSLCSADHVGEMLACYRRHPGAGGVLSVMPVPEEQLSKSGIVALEDGRVRLIVEKPGPAEAPSRIASLPLYLFSPRILTLLPQVKLSPRGEYELQDAIQALIEQDGPILPVFAEHRLTVTGPADLLAINRYYLERDGERLQVAPAVVGPQTLLLPPLGIEPGTVIGRDAVIGPRVYIERGCCIGDGATISDAIILRGATVPGGANIVNEVVC